MLKVRVGDLVSYADSEGVYLKVARISGEVFFLSVGTTIMTRDVTDVIRPARIKPRMTRKEAREWHRKQACWELSRTQENYCASCDGDGVRRCAYGKTEVAAVRALMAKMGAKR